MMEVIKSTAGVPVSITVVIPVYKGNIWIQRCLDSLDRQSIPKSTFEVILVFNGPDDGGLDIARRYQDSHLDLNIRIIVSNVNNAAKARNVGLDAATGSHLTWVDVDDVISQNYLLSLALAADNNVIPVAQLANIDQHGDVTRDNAINTDLMSQSEAIVPPEKFVRATTFMTGKLLPTDWASKYPLNEGLRSGEDVAFYGKLLSKYQFSLSVMPGLMGATYYRQLVPYSVSRGRVDRTFMVDERAFVIKSLDDSIRDCSTTNAPILQGYINSQLSFIRTYISNHPDQRISIMDFLSGLNVDNMPWSRFYADVDDLAVCYNFAPFSDTGANVAAKRIRETGHGTDVISNDMSKVRAQHKDNSRLAAPYIARHNQLKVPLTFADSSLILAFVSEGMKQYRKNVKSGRTYKRIYSRSMWPASHFLAAAIKLKDPSLRWTAEFSDPVRLTTEGTIRKSPILFESARELIFGIDTFDVPDIFKEDQDVYAWTEFLPYAFADEILFTNSNQLELMIDSAPKQFVERIREVSSVSHHPTLPRQFYEIGRPNGYGDDSRVKIGYFGEFYSTRGLREILDSLLNLSADEQARIALHIHSSTPIPEEYGELIGKTIFMHGKLSYYDFLSSLNEFDCLVVNDASTSERHKINPYLPSKYSDYKGSLAPIWSVVEDGSVLSTLPVEYKSELGDFDGATKILKLLLTRQR